MANWLIIKSNYVIDVVQWNPESAPDWDWGGEYDLKMEDPIGCVSIGDWWESDENIFYKPLSIPPDWPDEILIT
jgi:hypothetical protein